MFRRSPRALALRAAALVVAVVTAAVVASDLASLHRRAGDLGPERDAIVATRDLAVGDTLEGADLAVRHIHESQLPTGVLLDTGAAMRHVVTVPVLRGSFVLVRDLAPRHRTGLDGIVPEGMRAIRVTVTGALRPRPGLRSMCSQASTPGAPTQRVPPAPRSWWRQASVCSPPIRARAEAPGGRTRSRSRCSSTETRPSASPTLR